MDLRTHRRSLALLPSFVAYLNLLRNFYQNIYLGKFSTIRNKRIIASYNCIIVSYNCIILSYNCGIVSYFQALSSPVHEAQLSALKCLALLLYKENKQIVANIDNNDFLESAF